MIEKYKKWLKNKKTPLSMAEVIGFSICELLKEEERLKEIVALVQDKLTGSGGCAFYLPTVEGFVDAGF